MILTTYRTVLTTYDNTTLLLVTTVGRTCTRIQRGAETNGTGQWTPVRGGGRREKGQGQETDRDGEGGVYLWYLRCLGLLGEP